MSLDEWILTVSSFPMVKYWLTVLKLEVLLLTFLKSVRTGDFNMYIKSLRGMIPWFFALDHPNYSRWLCIHLKDMIELKIKAPKILQEFVQGTVVLY